ncbi:hypothetical protein GCM10027063_34120 [Promicromonospora xylanilytica]
MLRAKPEGSPASTQYPAVWAHGRRTRDDAHEHATTHTHATTQAREGHSDATDAAAWQGQASGQTAGPADPPDIGSRLLQIEAPRAIPVLVRAGHLLL